MHISSKTLYDFHTRRTTAHINCLNYFAGLLGYHFPEHDNDKHSDTIRTGYVYYNYAKYHPDYTFTSAQQELFEFARREHHYTQPHHFEYYSDVRNISDITLVEMVCDWHSASFEQRYLTHEDPMDYTVRDWFNLLIQDKYPFTQHQIDFIYQLIDFLDMYTNHDDAMRCWLPMLEI